MAWYRKYYRCSECGHEWQDEWDCLCNDRCPKCNAEIEPYDYEDLDEPDLAEQGDRPAHPPGHDGE